ncbi:MAG: fused MFS/spermidine synthase, partial [Myxococcota bacterium]
MKPALALCFFVSGATSLVLEVAWAKELSYLLGNTLYAISTVVAAFMAGLAFGSWLASRYLRDLRHSLRSYALLQCAIALCGYFSIPVLRGAAGIFEPLYGEFAGHPVAFLTARFAVVLALMSVPVTLMGMTLPVVVGGFRREPGPYARATGLLYGVNTLGAVTGTLTAGFALIPALGLAVTCASVGLVDAAVGVIAFCLHRATSRSDGGVDRVSAAPTAPAAAMLGPRARAVSLLYFGSGLVAIALEVTWFRYLVYVFGPTADAFSVMLGIYLAGVGLGSVLGARLVAPSGSSVERVALLQIVVAALVLLATLAYNDLPSWYMGLYWKLPSGDADLSAALAQAATGAFVVLPATLAMGALFPSVVRCFAGVARQPVAAERGVGLLYAQNTCGGILGSLLAGFWLLPGFGLWNALLAASATSLLIGIGFLLLSSARASRKAAIAAGALAVVFALGFGSPKPDLLALNRGLNLVFFNDPEFDASAVAQYEADRRLLFYREGVNASVAITANDGGDGALALRVSGKPVASTGLVARTHLEMLGQLPVLFARSPRRVAVVGFGAGVTAGAVLASPLVEALDVVELEPAVIEASRYFAQSNGDPLADDRTRIVVEDGRTFLRYTSRKYDVITADPISPVAAGAANLYTTGFYEVASRRLAEGGV